VRAKKGKRRKPRIEKDGRGSWFKRYRRERENVICARETSRAVTGETRRRGDRDSRQPCARGSRLYRELGRDKDGDRGGRKRERKREQLPRRFGRRPAWSRDDRFSPIFQHERSVPSRVGRGEHAASRASRFPLVHAVIVIRERTHARNEARLCLCAHVYVSSFSRCETAVRY